MYNRILQLDIEAHNAFFLWGPRKVGKSSYLKLHFKSARYFDLLDRAVEMQFRLNPGLLKELIGASLDPLVIVDEIQKIPALLDDVHWCLENTPSKFILCGSSALKLKRSAANLLGGRAWRYEMMPLTIYELGKDFEWLRAINHGLIPQHYQSNHPDKFFQGYIYDYLQEEIQAEAKLRHVEIFARFLEVVANTHGQLLNYANVASQCGVSAKTIRAYYQILQDTLLGYRLPPWTHSKNKRLIETEKFYLFDCGLARGLQHIPYIEPKTTEFGRSFEHIIINEVRAYLSYKDKNLPIYFWRTSTGQEVDLIVGHLDLCLEIKASSFVREQDLKGLKALCDDQEVKQAIVVSQDKELRKIGNILIMPWQFFCEQLWSGKLC